MCGIAGVCDFCRDLTETGSEMYECGRKMVNALKHRGPDDMGIYIAKHAMFAHTRLAVIDVENGIQPMTAKYGGFEYTIVYNGELYNLTELRNELKNNGFTFETKSDTEAVLLAYIMWGEEFVERLNGIFAIAIWDGRCKKVVMYRDRMGVKPFFYANVNGVVVFSSEIKGIFCYKDIEPEIDINGLMAVFGTGPARIPGSGVFKGINELLPGYMLRITHAGIENKPYWQLNAVVHYEDYEETLAHTRELLVDSIKRQMISDVPLCCLLSGGVDSSLVSYVAGECMKKKGNRLSTYSFDFSGNELYYKPSVFQPSSDRPYVEKMAEFLKSSHKYLVCGSRELYNCLYRAVDAKDLPGMADVDASLLYFAEKIKEEHTVCLSGECADEIFGGYPWFRDNEIYEKRSFPWSKNMFVRENIVNREIINPDKMNEYVNAAYENTVANVPCLFDEDDDMKRRREISYLNIKWFMATLLMRKDMMTMASGLEVRVPFADHRLVEYIYNVPWEMKYHNNTVKGLLRDSMRGTIPDEILYRKKSPYPKTYNPEYEGLLKNKLTEIITDKGSPLRDLIDIKNVEGLINGESNYDKPWFGQLMAGPQMLAYLIQTDYWLTKYKIKISI